MKEMRKRKEKRYLNDWTNFLLSPLETRKLEREEIHAGWWWWEVVEDLQLN